MRRVVPRFALATALGAALAWSAVWFVDGGRDAVPSRRAAPSARSVVTDDERARLAALPARDGADVSSETPNADRPADADPVASDAAEDGASGRQLSAAEVKNRAAVDLAGRGESAQAIALLREAHALEPENALYGRNLQAALINAGFADVTAEHFDQAVTRFVEARQLGDRPEIGRGLGYAYYRLGNLDLARTTLEQALAAGGDDVETYLTLGRIYLERHDQERALAMFDHAVAAGADRPGLAATVERLRRDAEAERDFQSLASSHFVLKFEGHENIGAGRIVLNALEDAYRRVGARFAYYPLERLEVILYPDEEFREITNSPHWSGAVYDGRIKLPVGGLARGSERVARTLRHEYAHAAIVTLSRGKAPVWLNEGLAQVAEETEEPGRAGRLRMALAQDGLVPLSALESGFTELGREDASLAYAEAYFAADYLLRKKGGYNVRRLLEAMATAASIDEAFRQALSLPYTDFERQFLRNIR
ncbi:MAG: tetratricopeptide repeat protein [Deltaproteobacteria bacterium]|nr:tetratricopeptide repeat protein [Deltaproteobacteria bacterium]